MTMISLFPRYIVFCLCVVVTIVALPFAASHEWVLGLTIIAGLLSLVGVHDVVQRRHAILRNYPVIGNIRYLVETIRPEIRQYLLEGDDDELPYSRSQRSLVYRRAKKVSSETAFGSLLDVYGTGYQFMGHSSSPVPSPNPDTFRIEIGGPQCTQPYSASVFNISAMSFGALSANAIRALNKGAKAGNFAHDTGEGAISRHHREFGGDLIWELGTGYFGCCSEKGEFDADKFADQSRLPQVKMIEIKLSQGAKPGRGGILPADKVSAEISETRGVPMGKDCLSPARHSAFDTPIEMMHFIAKLRELSGGKPIGFKLCLGHPWEFMGIVKAMLETEILPDFIVVDGAEGGTGASPVEFTNHIGVPMREGLLLVHNTLTGTGLRSKIKIGAAGRIVSAFDIASVIAIGADWVNAGRAFMFAIGCIQSRSCNTNRCPTGVATQDKLRQRALVVEDKGERVANYHMQTMKALASLLGAAGLDNPDQLMPHHMARRISATETRLFSQLHYFAKPKEILEGKTSDFYRESWQMARADRFDVLRG